jgi:hypothetical protein
MSRRLSRRSEWVRVRTHLLEGIGLGTTWARSRAYAVRAGLLISPECPDVLPTHPIDKT